MEQEISMPSLHGWSLTIDAIQGSHIEYHGEKAAEDLQDTEVPDVELQNIKETETVPINFGDAISPQQVEHWVALVQKYRIVFSGQQRTPEEIPHLPPFDIVLKPDTKPISCKPRFIPTLKLDWYRSKVADDVKAGRRIPAPHAVWGFPPVIVKKPDGSFRDCTDFSLLNRVTQVPPAIIPDQRQIQDRFHGKKFLMVFDMCCGFKQIPTSQAAQEVLVTVTPFGKFADSVMPYGPSGAPHHFQWVISTIFQDVSEVAPFFDDLGVACDDDDHGYRTFEKILMICTAKNIRLNARKCQIGFSSVRLLGRIVSGSSVAPDPKNLEALITMRSPQNTHELHSFIGLVNWFSVFVPHIATLLEPFTRILSKSKQFHWEPEHELRFRQIVDAIYAAKPLALRIPDAPIKIRTDASTVGIAGAVMQQDPTTHLWALLALYSRQLTSAERHYSTIELEFLAIIYTILRARNFGFSKLIIETDHSNLQFLQRSENSRVVRWRVFLSEYDFTVVHIQGRNNPLLDYLSRTLTRSPGDPMPVLQIEGIEADKNIYSQPIGDDLICQAEEEERLIPSQLLSDLPGRWENNVYVLNEKPSPETLALIWASCHSSLMFGHCGAEITIRKVMQYVKWPGMQHDLRKLVAECPTCQKIHAQQPRAPMLGTTAAQFPFQSVLLDHNGPHEESSEGYKHILVMLDRFSGYTILEPAHSVEAEETVSLLLNSLIPIAGVPELITTDAGSTFTSNLFKKTVDMLGAKLHTVMSGHHEGVGAVEIMNVP